METTLELPAKRSNEEVFGSCSGSGSGSREEASKKAKTEPGSDRDGPHFQSFDECLEYFDGDYPRAGKYWQGYKDELQKKCKLLELKYFLKYKGQLDKANSLRTYDDYLGFVFEDLEEGKKFNNRPWVMRPTPGCYDDYQRLFVNDFRDPDGIYCVVHCSLDSDRDFLKFYEELKLKVEKSSRSIDDIYNIMVDLSRNYKIRDPYVLNSAAMDSHIWITREDLKKGFIPVFTKLWHETVINERRIDEVVKDILEHDKELHSECKRIFQDDTKRNFGTTSFTLAELTKYITAKAKGNSVSDRCPDDLVRAYFLEDPTNTFTEYTYSTYVTKKMEIAEKLGIIDSSAST